MIFSLNDIANARKLTGVWGRIADQRLTSPPQNMWYETLLECWEGVTWYHLRDNSLPGEQKPLSLGFFRDFGTRMIIFWFRPSLETLCNNYLMVISESIIFFMATMSHPPISLVFTSELEIELTWYFLLCSCSSILIGADKSLGLASDGEFHWYWWSRG